MSLNGIGDLNINDPSFVWAVDLKGTEDAITRKHLMGKRKKKCNHEHVSKGVCLTCGKENCE